MPFVNRCGGQSVELQSKIVYPSSSPQTITPDEGYDGFSQIVTNPRVVASVGECIRPTQGSGGIRFTINASIGAITEDDPPRAIYIGIDGEPQVYANTTGCISGVKMMRQSLSPLKYSATVTILGYDNDSRGLYSDMFDTFTVIWNRSNLSLVITYPDNTVITKRDYNNTIKFANSYAATLGTEESKYWAILLW